MKDIGQKMVLSDFSVKGRKPNASGGRTGFFQGALADTKEGKAMSPGTTASGGHRTGGDGATIESPIIDKSNFNVEPLQTLDQNQYLDKFGAGINFNRAHAAGLFSLKDLMEGSIKPDLYANYQGDNFNIAGQKTKDMTGLYGTTSLGPVNFQGAYEDVDGDVNKNIGASTQFGNFGIGTNYNFEGKPTYGASYNTDNFSGGLTYDGEPNFTFGFKKVLEPTPKILGKNYAKGGLAGILEL